MEFLKKEVYSDGRNNWSTGMKVRIYVLHPRDSEFCDLEHRVYERE